VTTAAAPSAESKLSIDVSDRQTDGQNYVLVAYMTIVERG